MSATEAFEAALRQLEQADGVPRLGLAGWWAEAVIDGEAYEVGVTSGHPGGCRWGMRWRGNHRRSGVEPTSPGAWQAGFDAVDAHRAVRAELAALMGEASA